jgi:hypothetical protein
MNTNSKWILAKTTGDKVVKHLEKKLGINLHELGLRTNFLDMMPCLSGEQ